MTANPQRRPRIVIKLGSSSVTRHTGPDPTLLSATLEACLSAREAGWDCVLVSSGAVSSGAARLAHPHPDAPPASAALQAALGQPYLMGMYVQLAGFLHGQVCQLLVSQSDVASPPHMQALKRLIVEALQHQVVPIVNGNDAVDSSQLDNDALAAGLAVMLQADRLLLLTDVQGVLDSNDQVITQAHPHDLGGILTRPGGSGRGGIRSKLAAAEVAALGGVTTVIARAQEATSISRTLNGQPVGTLIGAVAKCPPSTESWLAAAAPQQGTLTINREAEASIRNGSSLYGSGVKRVKGSFTCGDVVAIRSPAGHLLGRGVVNTSNLLLSLMRALRKEEVDILLVRCLMSSVEAEHADGWPLGGTDQPMRRQLAEAMATVGNHAPQTRHRLAADVLNLLNRYAIEALIAHTTGTTRSSQDQANQDQPGRRGSSQGEPKSLPNVRVIEKTALHVFPPARAPFPASPGG